MKGQLITRVRLPLDGSEFAALALDQFFSAAVPSSEVTLLPVVRGAESRAEAEANLWGLEGLLGGLWPSHGISPVE